MEYAQSNVLALEADQLAPKELREASLRQTPDQSFARILREGIGKSSRILNRSLNAAGYAMPAAAVVGAAINGAAELRDLSADIVSSGRGDGLGVGLESDSPMAAIYARAQNGDPAAQMLTATEQMQQQNQVTQLGLINLQNSLQNDTQKSTFFSNYLKLKHENARNILSNLK